MYDSQVDHPAHDIYGSAVNEAVLDLVGIDYNELSAMAPVALSQSSIEDYQRKGAPPTEFAEALRLLLCLKRNDGRSETIPYNLFQVAMNEFAQTTRWEMGDDGRARMGELCMEVLQQGEKTGFAVRPKGTSLVDACVRLDIGDAVRAALFKRRNTPDVANTGLVEPANEEIQGTGMRMG